MWERVVGQERAVGLLQRAAERPVHAYLLVGPRGSGLEDAARCFEIESTAYEGDDPNCTPHVYSAGGTNAFVDVGGGDVHLIRNESGAVAKTVAVQFIPAGATRRQDAPNPGNCPF